MANQSFTRSSILTPNKYDSVLVGNPGFYNYWIGKYTGGAVSNARIGIVPGYGFAYAKRNSSNIEIALLATSGKFIWQKNLVTGYGLSDVVGVGGDSSGNVYACYYATNSAGNTDALVIKYNASGTLQWSKFIGDSSSQEVYGFTVDTSGNSYVGLLTYTGGSSSTPHIIKIDNTGTISWQKYGTSNAVMTGIAIGSTGNVYGGGYTTSSYAKAYVVKLNSSGDKQWDYNIYNTSGQQNYPHAIAIDSSENVYIAGYDGYAETQFIVKLDSSGNLQWQRKTDGTGTCYGIATDSSANVYVKFPNGIFKFDTSGTLQWQRKITTPNMNYNAGNLIVNNNGHAFPVATTPNWINYLPNDGSGTGTYTMTDATSIVYESTSVTTSTATNLSTNSPAASWANASLTATTVTPTETSTTKTFLPIGIG